MPRAKKRRHGILLKLGPFRPQSPEVTTTRKGLKCMVKRSAAGRNIFPSRRKPHKAQALFLSSFHINHPNRWNIYTRTYGTERRRSELQPQIIRSTYVSSRNALFYFPATKSEARGGEREGVFMPHEEEVNTGITIPASYM